MISVPSPLWCMKCNGEGERWAFHYVAETQNGGVKAQTVREKCSACDGRGAAAITAWELLERNDVGVEEWWRR